MSSFETVIFQLPRRAFATLLLLSLTCFGVLGAAGQATTPPLEGRVNDRAGLLSAHDRDLLDSRLARYEEETSHQFVVLTVARLDGSDINAFSLQIAQEWRLGHKSLDNGVLVMISREDKQIRIQLGRGFERYISDEMTRKIIKINMLPAFSKGNFARGLNDGLDRLMEEGRRFKVSSFSIGSKVIILPVHWQWATYAAGYILCFVFARRRARQNLLSGWHPRDIDDIVMIYCTLGLIIGGRIEYVLLHKPSLYLSNPIEIFALWQGGISFHGSFLGVLIALWFLARRRGKQWFEVTDFVAPLAPICLAAVQLGNFIGYESCTAPTAGLWSEVIEILENSLRLPPQLYGFVIGGVLLPFSLWLFTKRRRPTGAASGLFLIGYGAMGLVAERACAPTTSSAFDLLGLSVDLWLSLLMSFIGAAVMVWAFVFWRQLRNLRHV